VRKLGKRNVGTGNKKKTKVVLNSVKRGRKKGLHLGKNLAKAIDGTLYKTGDWSA